MRLIIPIFGQLFRFRKAEVYSGMAGKIEIFDFDQAFSVEWNIYFLSWSY